MTSSGMEQETVKFKLVEDLSLVTIPITTCLLVLLGNKYSFLYMIGLPYTQDTFFLELLYFLFGR